MKAASRTLKILKLLKETIRRSPLAGEEKLLLWAVNTHCNAFDSYYPLETVRFKSGPGTNEMEPLKILYRAAQFMNLLTDGPLLPFYLS